MGTLGWQETVVIFILALVLFGPKKLPELGRTLGKAITEFRRASSELKSTFDREMKNLEQETQPVKQALNEYQYDTYNYDYSTGTPYDHSYGAGESESASHPQITSASAPEGAESPSPALPEGTVAYGVKPEAGHEPVPEHGTPAVEAPAAPEAATPVSTATEHKA
jgi:TatA/E family protein of Tat protein translocase